MRKSRQLEPSHAHRDQEVARSRGPIRVLWLTKGLGLGGAERLLSLSLARVDRNRFHVDVAYVLPWKDALVDEIQAHGVDVHCLGSPSPRAAWPRRLRRLLQDRAYNIVHTHSPLPAVAARIFLPRRTVAVHTEHNEWPRYRRLTRVTNAATYQRNTAVLAVSQGVADSIRRPRWSPWVSLPPVEVVHHGIDESRVRRGPEARSKARRLLGIEKGQKVVGSVANFSPKKDQRTLLEAVRRLVPRHPDVRVVLVGTGPLEPELRRQASEPDLVGRVHFAGLRDDVQAILPAFDVFALSSLHEGLPIALLEAMATGLPCVATRVGGAPELIADGHSGFLVPPRSARDLAAAIDEVLCDAELASAFGKASVEIAGGFSIGSAVRRTESIYEEILARR